MCGMSMTKDLYEIYMTPDKLYKCKCKICGYVTVSLIERLAEDLMREHLKTAHNIKL